MFGILLRDQNSLEDKLSLLDANKLYVYLTYGNHKLVIVADSIPKSLKNLIKPVYISTNISEPVQAYQHYHFDLSTLYDPEHQRKLMSIKSGLNYTASEYLSPDNFYFKLDQSKNSSQTFRDFTYQLKFDDVQCYVEKDDSLFEKFTEKHFGLMIVSTYSLDFQEIPKWYIRETFRDIIELKEINMENKDYIVGPNSGEIYLYFKEENNLSEELVEEIAGEIHGRIRDSINLQIFPRGTPKTIINNKRLISSRNGKYTFFYEIPKNIPILNEIYRQNFLFDSLSKVYLFLSWLIFVPTYRYIEKEMKIWLKTYGTQIYYETKYLPDFIRVINASHSHKELENTEIYYPDLAGDKLSKLLEGKFYIKFYDNEYNQSAIIANSIPIEMPLFSGNDENMTLEKRIDIDRDLKKDSFIQV